MPGTRRLLYLLVLIKLLLPFLLQHPVYQPHRDEFLYLAESRHMSWGYMEVPPLLSVFGWLNHLAGNSLFIVKWWPAFFGALTYLLVGKIILSLNGKTFALILGFLPFVFDVYIRLFFLFQPNFLEVFFWTMLCYSIVCYVQTGRNKWLYILGFSIGLGMMSKYSAAFFTASLLTGLALTKYRRVYANKHFYFSLIIALLIFLPNIIWQYMHRFPLFHHMKELQETQLQYIHPADFLINQLLMNLPCVFIWLAGLWFVLFTQQGSAYKLFAWAYVSVIVILLALHGKDYYSLGVYPVLFAFGAVQLERFTSTRRRWLRIPAVVFPVALGLLVMPLMMPVFAPAKLAAFYTKTGLQKSAALKWEDLQYHPLPQDFADMMGWKETTAKAAAVYNSLPPEERKATLVYARDYGFAGALNFYGPAMGLPEVYSDNASFLLWMPQHYRIRNLILIGHRMPDSTDAVFNTFARKSIKDSLNKPLAREQGVKIILFEQANSQTNPLIEQSVASQKAVFIR